MRYLEVVLISLAVALLTAIGTVATIYETEPWKDDIAVAVSRIDTETVPPHTHTGDEVTLNWDTKVIHEWISDEGVSSGGYETTLYEYHNYSTDILELSVFKNDVEMIIYECATDPEKRGILLRHDFTPEKVDQLAAHFAPDSSTESFAAFTETTK